MRIEMLPASYGDCILIEYGERPYRVLIDGGLAGTRKALLRRIGKANLPMALELLVVSHIDADHIAGILSSLRHTQQMFTTTDIWFNGYVHLPGEKPLGAKQGEDLSFELERRKWSWNDAFGKQAVQVASAGPLPTKSLAGDAEITLLSPGDDQLRALRVAWKRELEAAGLEPGGGTREVPKKKQQSSKYGVALGDKVDVAKLAAAKFDEDAAPANGSSIAFLFRHGGKQVLFGADAHPSVLLSSLRRHQPNGKIKLDAFKLPHHGSKNNLSRELLDAIECPTYLVSTNGKRFGHPDAEAIARILDAKKARCDLHFNYASTQTLLWRNAALQRKHEYRTFYPSSPQDGIELEL